MHVPALKRHPEGTAAKIVDGNPSVTKEMLQQGWVKVTIDADGKVRTQGKSLAGIKNAVALVNATNPATVNKP